MAILGYLSKLRRGLGLQSFTKYLRLAQFSRKIAHQGKSLISVFQEYFGSIDKIFLLAGRLDTRVSFMKFRHLPDIS